MRYGCLAHRGQVGLVAKGEHVVDERGHVLRGRRDVDVAHGAAGVDAHAEGPAAEVPVDSVLLVRIVHQLGVEVEQRLLGELEARRAAGDLVDGVVVAHRRLGRGLLALVEQLALGEPRVQSESLGVGGRFAHRFQVGAHAVHADGGDRLEVGKDASQGGVVGEVRAAFIEARVFDLGIGHRRERLVAEDEVAVADRPRRVDVALLGQVLFGKRLVRALIEHARDPSRSSKPPLNGKEPRSRTRPSLAGRSDTIAAYDFTSDAVGNASGADALGALRLPSTD